MFENLQRALSFDQASISKRLIDLKMLKARFAVLLEHACDAVESVQPNSLSGSVDRIIAHFFADEVQEVFIKVFIELQITYAILSPDTFLRPYIDDYALVADIYLTVYSYFDPEAQQRRLERDLLKNSFRNTLKSRMSQHRSRSTPSTKTLPM